jgi:hypothetical protein
VFAAMGLEVGSSMVIGLRSTFIEDASTVSIMCVTSIDAGIS